MHECLNGGLSEMKVNYQYSRRFRSYMEMVLFILTYSSKFFSVVKKEAGDNRMETQLVRLSSKGVIIEYILTMVNRCS